MCALFVQQYDDISTDTDRRAGLSAKAEPLVSAPAASYVLLVQCEPYVYTDFFLKFVLTSLYTKNI